MRKPRLKIFFAWMVLLITAEASAGVVPPTGGLMLHAAAGASYCRSEILERERQTFLRLSSDCVCTGAAGSVEEIALSGDVFKRSEASGELDAVAFVVEFLEDKTYQAMCSGARVTGVWLSEN